MKRKRNQSGELSDIALPGLGSNAEDIVALLDGDNFTKYSLGYHDINDRYDAVGWLVSYVDKKGGLNIKSHDFGRPGHSSYSDRISEWNKKGSESSIDSFIKSPVLKHSVSKFYENGGRILSALEVLKLASNKQASFNIDVSNALVDTLHEMLPNDDAARISKISKNIGIGAIMLCTNNLRNKAEKNDAPVNY